MPGARAVAFTEMVTWPGVVPLVGVMLSQLAPGAAENCTGAAVLVTLMAAADDEMPPTL